MTTHDTEIREPLFDFLEGQFEKIRILEEKTMGKSRADVVMVTEEALYGIEIKSDADTYARLERQVKDYDKYYDFNIAVVGSSHALHIEEHVPDYWGIITVELVEGELDFYVLRKPAPNPKVSWERKLELLWKPELASIQEKNDMPKYKNLSRAAVAEKFAERIEKGRLDEELLRRQVSEVLFERDYTTAAQMLAEYRKGELQKKIETETDPYKRAELMIEQASRRGSFKSRGKRNKRRKR